MQNLSRRDALKAMGALAATAGAGSILGCAQTRTVPTTMSEPVKWSTGLELPRTKVPANAADCHHHIYDSRYPWAPEATLKPGDGIVADYRKLQKRIGTSRNVIVQPSSYGTDNRLLIESLGQFGGKARGVAVVTPAVTDAQLMELHKAGTRGIRFNLSPPGTTTLDMVKPLASRVAKLGWHVQVNAPAKYLLEQRTTWSDLPCQVVFDHQGHVGEASPQDATFTMIRDLLQQGRAYVKLSGFYFDGKVGPPTYADRVAVASAYAKAAPERCVWGSDWPHPTEQPRNAIPNDAFLLDAFAAAVPDEAARNRILVDNAMRLYQFEA